MPANGNDSDDANSNNLSFTIKDTKLYFLVVTLSMKEDFLAKDLKNKFVGINITQKVGIKIQQMSMEVFLNEVL